MAQYKGLEWVSAFNGAVPMGAISVSGGRGETMYVARAVHRGDLVPGKLHPSHRVCYVSWGGTEHAKPSYEVLVNRRGCSLSWVRTSAGNLPSGSIQGGRTSSGEALIVGRASYDGYLIPGKVHPSHKTLYLPYGGQEVAFKDYEVLVITCLEFE